MHVFTSILPQVLRVDEKFWVLVNDALVIVRAYQILVFLSLLMLWDELCAHIGRPEVCWSWHSATKPLLELRRVEHLDKTGGSAIRGEHDFCLRLLVNERRDTLV